LVDVRLETSGRRSREMTSVGDDVIDRAS
jgi:hypothetical protein